MKFQEAEATFTFILNPCVQLFARFPADKKHPFVKEIERKKKERNGKEKRKSKKERKKKRKRDRGEKNLGEKESETQIERYCEFERNQCNLENEGASTMKGILYICIHLVLYIIKSCVRQA